MLCPFLILQETTEVEPILILKSLKEEYEDKNESVSNFFISFFLGVPLLFTLLYEYSKYSDRKRNKLFEESYKFCLSLPEGKKLTDKLDSLKENQKKTEVNLNKDYKKIERYTTVDVYVAYLFNIDGFWEKIPKEKEALYVEDFPNDPYGDRFIYAVEEELRKADKLGLNKYKNILEKNSEELNNLMDEIIQFYKDNK